MLNRNSQQKDKKPGWQVFEEVLDSIRDLVARNAAPGQGDDPVGDFNANLIARRFEIIPQEHLDRLLEKVMEVAILVEPDAWYRHVLLFLMAHSQDPVALIKNYFESHHVGWVVDDTACGDPDCPGIHVMPADRFQMLQERRRLIEEQRELMDLGGEGIPGEGSLAEMLGSLLSRGGGRPGSSGVRLMELGPQGLRDMTSRRERPRG